MTAKDQTGFDAFFQAVTRSPEFKTVVTTDWKKEAKSGYDAGIIEMESNVKKLSESYDKFQVSIPTGLLFYGPPGTGKLS